MRRKKRHQQLDPARAEQIRARREKEAALRAHLDDVMRQGKALGDRAHYDHLGRVIVDQSEVLVPKLTAAVKRLRELVLECLGENLQLALDCNQLESEIATRQGKPDPHAFDDAMLEALPPEQAQALRFTVELGKLREPRPPSLIQESFQKAAAQVEALRQLESEALTLCRNMTAIAHEKVRRGWVQQADIEPLMAGAEGSLAAINPALTHYSNKLEEAATRRDEALARRSALEASLASLKS